MQRELATLVTPDEFGKTGFVEVWSVDLSESYYSVGHPGRRPDMFFFKPGGATGSGARLAARVALIDEALAVE